MNVKAEEYVQMESQLSYVNIKAGTKFAATASEDCILEATKGGMHFTTGDRFIIIKWKEIVVD